MPRQDHYCYAVRRPGDVGRDVCPFGPETVALVLWDASASAIDTPVRRDRRRSVCWLALNNSCCVRRKPRALRRLTRKAASPTLDNNAKSLFLTPAMVVVPVPTAVVLLLIVVFWPVWPREHIPARLSIMLASANQRDYNSTI